MQKPFAGATASTFSAVVLALMGAQAPSAFAQTIHNVTVKRWTGAGPVRISNAQVDANFAEANTVLADDTDGNGALDSSDCNIIRMSRQGDVTTFMNGDGIVNSFSEMNTLLTAVNGRYKVVKSITYCGGIGAGIIGCSNLNGNSSVVVVGTEGDTWLHEFGHTEGLDDIPDLNLAVNDNVMAASAPQAQVLHDINANQCANFSNKVDLDGPGGSSQVGQRTPGPMVSAGSEDWSLIPIEDLAVRRFHEGIPYSVADFYGPEDVAILKQMLVDPDMTRHYNTIAGLIGIISDASEDDANSLIDYVRSNRGPDQGRASAMVGLGVIAAKSEYGGGSTALQFLIGEARKSGDVADVAISGLAVSGRQRALAELQALKRSVAGQRADDIEDAIDEHYRVAEVGLRRYMARAR